MITRGLPTFFRIFPLAMETSEFSKRKKISRVGLYLCTSPQVSPLAVDLASSPDLQVLSRFPALALGVSGAVRSVTSPGSVHCPCYASKM